MQKTIERMRNDKMESHDECVNKITLEFPKLKSWKFFEIANQNK